MRRLIIYAISLSILQACGIKKEIFRDDFNTNINRWSEARETSQERFFRGGQYHIINNESGKITWNTHNIIIDTNEDFIIETSVALNWEKDGGAYLIFGENRTNRNFHCMQITKAGNRNRVYIGKFIDGQWTGVWKNASLKPFGQQNILTVRKNGENLTFLVNNRVVHRKKFEPFFGNGIGVGCGAPQNVSFNYLLVKQDKQGKTSNYVYETRREATRIGSNKTTVELKKTGSVYSVPVELNGVLKIDFIFDSGASDVSISPDVALTLIRTGTIRDSDWLPGAYYRFADGSVAKSMRFKLRSVKIGDKTVYNVDCSISNSLDAPMLLGQSVLRQFGRYTFDYRNNALIIE